MGWQRYWDIVVYRTYAELKAEAQLSYMGYVWWVLEPLMNTILFYVVLAAVIGQPSVGAMGFLLVGSVIWQWFNASMIGAANTVVEAGGMLRQIYLPKVILPMISILTSSWKFLFLFILLMVFVLASGHAPGASYVLLPVLLLLEMLAILAFTLPLAFIMPYFPDARVTVDALLRSVMLISGILFSIDKVPQEFRFYFHLNPMADLIQGFRNILLDGTWPRWDLMLYVGGVCAAGLCVAYFLHALVDRSVVKAIHR